MSNLPQYLLRATDANGAPVAGALLYTYRAGGVIPEDTYADEAYSVANANPVVADGSGYFGPIYLNDFSYHLVLKDSTGVVLFDRDDVRAAYLTNSELRDRVLQIASSPLDFGAAGDGATDDSSALQLAIDTSTGTVDLLGKTYRCDSALLLKSGLTLRNGVLDFTNSADTECLSASGSEPGLPKALTGSVTHHSSVLPLANVNGLATGDLLKLYTTNSEGELCLISLIAALNVTVDTEIYHDYDVAFDASVVQFSPLADLRIENVTVIGNVAGTSTGLFMDHCRNVHVTGCTFSAGLNGLIFRDSLSLEVLNCKFDVTNGIVTQLAVQDVVIDSCTFFGNSAIGVHVAASLAGSGRSREVRVSNCLFQYCYLYVYQRSQFVAIDKNRFRGNHQYNIRCVGDDCEITNNHINGKNGDTASGIYIAPLSGLDSYGVRGEFRVSGNTIIGGIGRCIEFVLSKKELSNVVIEHNEIMPDAGSTYGIYFDLAGTGHLHEHHVKNLKICHNTIRQAATYSIWAVSADEWGIFDAVEISHNYIQKDAAGGSPISVYPCTIANISNNAASASTGSVVTCVALYLTVAGNQNIGLVSNGAAAHASWRPARCIVTGNSISGAAEAIYLRCYSSFTNHVVISNNVISGGTKGIYVVMSSYLMITGNRISAARCIHLAEGGNRAIVTGNYLESNTLDAVPNIDIGAATYGIVTGNLVVEGSVGISATASVSTTTHGNTIVGCTGATAGTTDADNLVVP